MKKWYMFQVAFNFKRGINMSRVCQITGKRPKAGNAISHSQRHTKRVFAPNIKKKNLVINGKKVKMKLSTRALRTLEKKGLI